VELQLKRKNKKGIIMNINSIELTQTELANIEGGDFTWSEFAQAFAKGGIAGMGSGSALGATYGALGGTVALPGGGTVVGAGGGFLVGGIFGGLTGSVGSAGAYAFSEMF
jgi:bacteriocin-like protein